MVNNELHEWSIFARRVNAPIGDPIFEENHAKRELAAKAVASFWADRTVDALNNVPEGCIFGGKNAENKYVTSEEVVSFKRLKRLDGNYFGGGHDYMCATDKTGQKFFFYSDQLSGYMREMFRDILREGGSISKLPSHYVPYHLKYTGPFA